MWCSFWCLVWCSVWCSVWCWLVEMATNWTIKRGMERRSDNVQDAAERLQELIARPSLVQKEGVDSVSYTHLTLPTILRV